MKAHLSRADVSYEAFFKKPLLDRPVSVPAPIQSVYDALVESFSISVADIQVNESTTPARASVTYNLFGGAGSIELRADRWRAAFRGLITPEDTALIIRCLSALCV